MVSIKKSLLDFDMSMIGVYKNGNCLVRMFTDGTKIRETSDDEFHPEFPESIDLKITNYCDQGCPFCHEDSSIQGHHANLMDLKFINTIHPFTEIAIGGGNPMSHPNLKEFLELLKQKHIIANMTVHQNVFERQFDELIGMSKNHLIHGLGVSFTNPSDSFIEKITKFPNAVIHVIAGIVQYGDLEKLADKDLKLLILGYKDFRRGSTYKPTTFNAYFYILYYWLQSLTKRFEVVSFDNLAVKQLNVKRLMTEEEWKEFYMGDDGQFTMYIDGVKKEYATSSVSVLRRNITDDIQTMFKQVMTDRIEEGLCLTQDKNQS